MKRIIEFLGLVFSGLLSIILANLQIPLFPSILFGVIFLVSWVSACIIYELYMHIKKQREDILSKDSHIRELEENSLPTNSCLTHRSVTAITDFLNQAKTDFYISGIINNSVINTFINNKEIIKECIKNEVKIHILFYVSDDEQNFNWYLRMLYGEDDPEGKISIDKDTYRSGLNTINKYQVFKSLMNNNLLEIRRLDTPATIAFIATDIYDNQNAKIQCQFYQYHKDSPESPVCQLIPSDEMFPTMRDVILDMWDSASQNLAVDYIENPTIRADEHIPKSNP